MSSYFKNKYDPSLQDIKKVFPDFEYTKKENWILQFTNDYHLTPSEMADFAYKKLDKVTTSFRMSNEQRSQMQDLITDNTIEKTLGWETYCSILTPKQLDYIGY
jgi:hypothetical protein|tara:strand:+ start:760 stop:1071 length:312 start_codon:yes stop_codon:yes gene_type:complete